MLFVMLGVLLIVLKLAEIGPPALWPWVGVLSPFAAAVVWWLWADMSGYTKRRAMDKMEEKKVERRRKALSAIGLDYRAYDKEKKAADRFKEQRRREAEKVESKREEQRKKHRDSVMHSRLDSSVSSQFADSTQQPKNPPH